MKKIFKHTLAGLLAAGMTLGTGCTDLDETLYDQLNETNIDFNSEKDVAAMMGQALAQFRYTHLSWFGAWELMEQCTDLYCVPYRVGIGWGDLYVNLHKHDWDYNVGHAENIWLYAYKCIGYCNSTLDVMPESNVENRAQLRFFRAMTYYLLLDLFRNVPILTTMNTEAGYLPEQSDAQQVFEFCVSELEAIKDDIGTTKSFGYGNKYVVEMTLAKLYLNKGVYLSLDDNKDGYEKALEYASDVIDNGGYSLSANYSDNFREDLSANNEIIFAIPEDRTHAKHFLLHTYSYPNDGMKAFASTANATNGSCCVPQFYDSYSDKDLRREQTWTVGLQYEALKNADGTYTPWGDKTKPIAFGNDNWKDPKYLCYSKEVHSIEKPGAYQQEGARMCKYEIPAGEYGTNVDDIPIYRLADAMFIKAECLLRLGKDEATAAQLVTDVRKRAFADIADATRTAAQLKGGSVYKYGHEECTSEGCTNWTDWVKTEEGGDDIEFGGLLDDLAWEFVGEEHRRQDLIRFKLQDGRNVFNGKSWFCKDATTSTTYNLFPIPKLALDANVKMKQNPGYSGAQ
jgi:hypothetical protein